MSDLFEEKKAVITVEQTETDTDGLEDIYDEDYDESYDDAILEEVENENSGTEEEQNEESDEVIDEVKNRYSNPQKEQDTLYIKVFERYFQKEIERNPYFANKYKPELVLKCYQWVKDNVKKLAKNNVAMIQSGKVFEMAVSYFDDEIYLKEQKAEEERKQKQLLKEQKSKEEQAKKEQKEQAKKEYEEWLKKPMKNSEFTEEERNKWLNAEQGELF